MVEPCLSRLQIESAGLDDWGPMSPALQTRYLTDSFATSIRLANALSHVAEMLSTTLAWTFAPPTSMFGSSAKK